MPAKQATLHSKLITILICTMSILLIYSCSKKTKETSFDSTQTYSIEGYLLSRKSGEPIVGRAIAVSQYKEIYSHQDPQVITDSNGYFKIYHTPKGDKNGLSIYPVYDDYTCIYHDISFITNIPKQQNVDLKKIYTSQF